MSHLMTEWDAAHRPTVAGTLQGAAAKRLKDFVANSITHCSFNMRGSEIYTTFSTMFVVDRTLDFIAHYRSGPALSMNRNTTGKSGATGMTLGGLSSIHRSNQSYSVLANPVHKAPSAS